jgi:nucleotide-binding universal stress UspA family protein
MKSEVRMRITKLVVGLDFSDTSMEAARWVTRFFAPSAQVVLAHAIEPADRPRFGLRVLPAPDIVERAAEDFAWHRVNELMRELSPPADVRAEVRVGKASQVVLDIANETNADLIVVGPHGGRPHTMKFLGSTADRIVRRSPVPVLVATNPPTSAPQDILVPVDDVSVTPELLAWVRELAESFDANVTLMHVWSNAVYSHVASMAHATAENDDEAYAEIRTELSAEGSRWLKELAATGFDRNRVNAVVLHGNAGDVTLDIAKSTRADLIAMGRHGSGLVAPALLGSTVGTVLHGARCPVLVVTGSSSEQKE